MNKYVAAVAAAFIAGVLLLNSVLNEKGTEAVPSASDPVERLSENPAKTGLTPDAQSTQSSQPLQSGNASPLPHPSVKIVSVMPKGEAVVTVFADQPLPAKTKPPVGPPRLSHMIIRMSINGEHYSVILDSQYVAGLEHLYFQVKHPRTERLFDIMKHMRESAQNPELDIISPPSFGARP